MVIKISQTASSIKQLYNIEGKDFYYQGSLGSNGKFQPISIFNKDTIIKGGYMFSKLINYIPLIHITQKENITRVFNLYKNDEKYGSIAFIKHGFLKSLYIISLDSGEIFYCYFRSKGSFDYVSVYKDEKQIALMETYLNTNDYKYTHKLYILDEYDDFTDTLSFFVLYYANYHFAKRYHISRGSFYQKAWSFSLYNNKYDPTWRETNFPNENFFGRTSLFK